MILGMARDPWYVRSTVSAALLVDFAVEREIAGAVALAGTGIEEAELTDPTVEIDLDQEFRIIRNILDVTGDEPGLGLIAGMAVHLPVIGNLGVALSACATVREMVEMWTRFADLSFAYVRYALETSGAQVLVSMDASNVPEQVRRFAIERDLTLIRTVQRELLSWDVPVQRLDVILGYSPVYEAVGTLLNVPEIRFDADRTALVLDAADLRHPMPQAHPLLRAQYERLCVETIQKRHARTGLSGQVRELLVYRGGLAGQTEVAADLNISVRTLRRRLADEGTSFRALSHETTGMLAEELLAQGFTVDTVAQRLGYSSMSAFSTAFRTWKGLAPGRFARESRQEASRG